MKKNHEKPLAAKTHCSGTRGGLWEHLISPNDKRNESLKP